MEKQNEPSKGLHTLVENYIFSLTALVKAIGDAKAREAAGTGDMSLIFPKETKAVGINIHEQKDTSKVILAIIREANPRFISGQQFSIDDYIPMDNLNKSIDEFRKEHQAKLAKRTELEKESQHREALRRREEDTKLMYRLALQYPDVIREIASEKSRIETNREP